MSHVVLLGDSIIDNRVYVSPDPDVRHQLQARLGGGWDVTLLAVNQRRLAHEVPLDAGKLLKARRND